MQGVDGYLNGHCLSAQLVSHPDNRVRKRSVERQEARGPSELPSDMTRCARLNRGSDGIDTFSAPQRQTLQAGVGQ